MYAISQANTERKNSPKKKKRKYSIESNNEKNILSSVAGKDQTVGILTVNIIDRMVDLSKFNRHTGLYVLSRSWINAATSISTDSNIKAIQSANKSNNNDLNSSESSNSYYITNLPQPLRQEIIISVEDVNEKIKTNIRTSESFDMNIINSLNVSPDDLIQTHALLKLHVNRWKATRKEWIKYYKATNESYKNSYDLLKSIYEEI